MRTLVGIGLVLAVAACSKAPDPATISAPEAMQPPREAAASASAPDARKAGVAWQVDDVDAAFAKARAEGKPVFLYWGAVWCPPCNQVKATIFNRTDFIERSRFFVPVYLDGDSRSAQRHGDRFKVGGYPTMILFTPEGREITRLPGEVDADQYMRVLAMGMSGARPVKATLAAALAPPGTKPGTRLSADDWRMLAYYSWDASDGELVAGSAVPATLSRLARACPADPPATKLRLELKAITAAATVKGAKPSDDARARKTLATVLAERDVARETFDLLTSDAGAVVAYITLPGSAERRGLVASWDAALASFAGDATLPAADRLSAVGARIELAKLGAVKGALPDALLGGVRDAAMRGERETVDPYAREVVVNAAADVLAEAGLFDESNALLTAELSRSRTPYYFMLGLASNAKKRGDKASAVDWAERAYAASSGPATRLQWGVSYVGTLIDLAPEDSKRIEQAVGQVIGELEPVPDTFYDRNRRSLERMARKLIAWGKDHNHADALRRIRAQLATVCAALPSGDPARATCEGVWNPVQSAAHTPAAAPG